MGLLRRIGLVIRSYVASAEDKIDKVAAEEELRQAALNKHADLPKQLSHTPLQRSFSRLDAEYKILGIKPGADLHSVETAWRQLALRADPKRFPSGSEEEKAAAQILDSINKAYKRIREELNPTEGRFGNLEL